MFCPNRFFSWPNRNFPWQEYTSKPKLRESVSREVFTRQEIKMNNCYRYVKTIMETFLGLRIVMRDSFP